MSVPLIALIVNSYQVEPSIKKIESVTEAHGYVLLYSVTSRCSFEMIQIVYNEIIRIKGVKKVPCVIAGTKIDLEQRYVIQTFKLLLSVHTLLTGRCRKTKGDS
jgi:GTPase SAR1 family protein